MIRFLIDGDTHAHGYQLVAETEHLSRDTLRSAVLDTPHKAALQARELADAAAALLESIPEFERVFELLHDAMDALPKGPA